MCIDPDHAELRSENVALRQANEYLQPRQPHAGRIIAHAAKAAVTEQDVMVAAAELASLPMGSVILDGAGDAWQKAARPESSEVVWHEAMEGFNAKDDKQMADPFYAPLTVIHEERTR